LKRGEGAVSTNPVSLAREDMGLGGTIRWEERKGTFLGGEVLQKCARGVAGEVDRTLLGWIFKEAQTHRCDF